MRDNRINYVVVGGFVLAIVVGLVAAIAVLSGRTGATDTYYARFDDVTGVAFGTQVLYQGYPIGQVEEVEPVREPGQRRFRLVLALRRGWPIDADAVAAVSQAGFLSAMVIDIEGGEAAELLAPGAEIRSAEHGDVLAALSGVAGDVTEILRDVVRPLLEDVGERVPEILAHANELSERLNQSSERLNSMLAPQNVERVGRVLANADSASQQLAALTADLGETRARLDRAMEALAALAEENQEGVGQAVTDLRYTLEAVARRIDAVAENLETTSLNMSEFSRRIRGDPSLLLRGESPPDDSDAGS